LDKRASPDMPLSRRIEESRKREIYHCFRLRLRTLRILRRHEAQVTAIAQALLKHKTLSEKEVKQILSSPR
jgi:ATP-dependent Zn protease